MNNSYHHHQHSLFTPTTTIVDQSKASATTTLRTQSTSQPEPLNIEITRDELAAQVIQSLTEHRRWERELTLGATDQELSEALGTCYASNPRLDIHCKVDPQPQLICISKIGQELLRLEAPEIAALIRIHVQIPAVPSETERQHRLTKQLDKERAKARNDIFTAAQRILGDKSRKREHGFTHAFVDLLFTDNCLEEENESATLERITSMLIARHWSRIKAMKAAIELVERAAGTWRSVEGYWLNRNYFKT